MQPPLAHCVKLDRPTFLVFSPALPLSQARSQETRVQETPSSLSPGPSPALAWPGPPDQGPAQPTWIYTRPGPVTPGEPSHCATPFLCSCDPPPGGCLHCTTHKTTLAPSLRSGPDSSVGSSLLSDCLLWEALAYLQGHGVGSLPWGSGWTAMGLLIFLPTGLSSLSNPMRFWHPGPGTH